VNAITSNKMTYSLIGLVTNNFYPTRLSQVSQAESPVVEEDDVFPVLLVNLQGVLVSSAFPTLTVSPIPCPSKLSLADNNTVLTVLSKGRVITKLPSGAVVEVEKR
jgi:hypothetical protein